MSPTWKRFHGQRFRRRVSDTESFQEDNQDVNLGLIRSKQKASDPNCDKNITTSNRKHFKLPKCRMLLDPCWGPYQGRRLFTVVMNIHFRTLHLGHMWSQRIRQSKTRLPGVANRGLCLQPCPLCPPPSWRKRPSTHL